MQIPVQITFRGVHASAAIESRIREKAAKLESVHDRITSCRVVVESPHRHHQKGRLYLIRIDVTVPGSELVVNTEKRRHHSHENVYVAIRDAFNAMRRQLENFAREHRGDVKTHEAPPQGFVARLFPDHGFIATTDQGDIYFHRNSVVGDRFDDLEEGIKVRFTAAPGDAGLQASTVHVVGARQNAAPGG